MVFCVTLNTAKHEAKEGIYGKSVVSVLYLVEINWSTLDLTIRSTYCFGGKRQLK